MIWQGNRYSIAGESNKIQADQVGLQRIPFKSARLLTNTRD
jgi:hypothetical protein